MRVAILPYDKAIHALEDLEIPNYTNDVKRSPGTITHFKIVEVEMPSILKEQVMVIWENDEPTPTIEEIKAEVDRSV